MRIAFLSLSMSFFLAACGGKSSPAPQPDPEPDPTPAITCAPAGCSGTICADAATAGDIMTTCEYRNEYACYQTATCEVQASGECGWTETTELTDCLAAGGPPAAE
jgi:hypothetical protein